MVKIYALVSGQLILYVGKTIQPLNDRKIKHKYKKTNTSGSKHIPDYIDWTITLLEEVPDEQGAIKEQYYIDTLKPFYNQRNVIFDKKEHNKLYHSLEGYKEYNRERVRLYRAKDII